MLDRRSILASAATLLGTLPLAAQQSPVTVVASFSILGDLVRAIGGDRLAVKIIVGAGQDAHVYKPTPADAKTIAGAALIVVNGLGFDTFMERLVRSSASKSPVVDLSKGVSVLKEAKQAHGHDHGHKHGGNQDPHIWQSIGNVKQMVTTLADALAKVDPAGAATYAANLAAYRSKLDALETELKALVATVPDDRRLFATTHDAFAYLARDFGLKPLALQGISTNAEPSAADIARIIRQLKALKAPAVFLENITDPRKIERIAQDSGARVGGTLYSDSLSLADGPVPTYIDLMRHNIMTLVKALKP